jgi:hypothetical protein
MTNGTFLTFLGIALALTPYVLWGGEDVASIYQRLPFEKFLKLRAMVVSGLFFIAGGLALWAGGK